MSWQDHIGHLFGLWAFIALCVWMLFMACHFSGWLKRVATNLGRPPSPNVSVTIEQMYAGPPIPEPAPVTAPTKTTQKGG